MEISGMGQNFHSNGKHLLSYSSWLFLLVVLYNHENQRTSALEGVYRPSLQFTKWLSRGSIPAMWVRHQGTGVWSWEPPTTRREGFWNTQALKKMHEVLALNPVTPGARSQLCRWPLWPPRTQPSMLNNSALEGPFSAQSLIPPDFSTHPFPFSCSHTVSLIPWDFWRLHVLSHFWTSLTHSSLPQRTFPLFRAWVLQHLSQDPNNWEWSTQERLSLAPSKHRSPIGEWLSKHWIHCSITIETNWTMPLLRVEEAFIISLSLPSGKCLVPRRCYIIDKW